MRQMYHPLDLVVLQEHKGYMNYESKFFSLICWVNKVLSNQ